MSETVKSYELSHDKGVVINGETFLYLVAVDPSWRVQQMPGMEEHLHVVWLPLIAEGACPDVGEPDDDTVRLIPSAAGFAKGLGND